MSLVFRNALMPSENQQVLRFRLPYLMYRFLFLGLSTGILLSTTGCAMGEFDQLMDKGWNEWDQKYHKEAVELFLRRLILNLMIQKDTIVEELLIAKEEKVEAHARN